MTSQLRRLLLIAPILVALACPTLEAQSNFVYVSSGAKLLQVDFDNPSDPLEVVNADSRPGLHGLVALDDGFAGLGLAVAQTPSDKVLFYRTSPLGGVSAAEISSGTIELPDGVTADSAGNLYLVNAGSRTGSDPTREVWSLRRDCPSCPGGYGTATLVDGTVPAVSLQDTHVVMFASGSGPLADGDLLVLSGDPAKVWRYPGATGPRVAFVVVGPSGFPAAARPTGMTFAPNGNLLVATAAGDVLRFDASGSRVLPDFASGLGSGKLKIAVGIQGGENRAFVTDRNGNRVHRLRIEAGGTGTLLDTVTGVSMPLGVTLRTSGAVPTMAGSGVVASPLSSYDLKFEQVTSSGLTSARQFLFADPAPGTPRLLSDVPGLLEAIGTPDREIPAHIRAFDLGFPPTPTFVLLVVDTTAGVADTQEHKVTIDDLGFVTSCSGLPNPPADQPRVFYTTDGDDPPLVEGDSFTDITTGCGSNFGRGGRTSLLLLGWDTRSVPTLAAVKVHAILDALRATDPDEGGLESFIVPGTQATLLSQLEVVRQAYRVGDIPGALAGLEDFLGTVRDNPGDFDNSTRNVAGELIARAESAHFVVCGAMAPACNRLLP